MLAYGLTEQQRAITGLVCQGMSTSEIAGVAGIAANTVQDHLKSVFDKVGVRSRRELVVSASHELRTPVASLRGHLDSLNNPDRKPRLDAEAREYVSIMAGEVRRLSLKCMATVGQVGNVDHENVSFGKAGRTRWMGKTPHNRGVSMNPVDHPHGGGDGKTSGGRPPVTPGGQPTRGFKTRNNKRTDKWIVTHKSKKR